MGQNRLLLLLLAGIFLLTGVPAPAQNSVTRIEQNDAAVAYSGSWYPNQSAANHGGSATLALDMGSSAVAAFTGTGIRWIGLADEYSGLARVYLDGELKSTVDTYRTPAQAQAALYSIEGLAAGAHTLRIEVTYTRNPASGGSWIWVDAFDILNGAGAAPPAPTVAARRVEQDDPSVIYSGSWHLNRKCGNSGLSATMTPDAGARASFTFEGTGIVWIGAAEEYSGIANVYLDGALQETVDTYRAPARFQRALFTKTGLAAGRHTLEIEVTGSQNPASGGAWVWIDAFEILSGPGGPAGSGASSGGAGASTRPYEEDSSIVAYSGVWYANHKCGNSGGGAVMAMENGARATVSFTGSGIQWLGLRDEWSGIARVYVDGVLKETIDTYLAPAAFQQVIYRLSSLPAGAHVLVVEATGTRNPASLGSWIWVDAFEITP